MTHLVMGHVLWFLWFVICAMPLICSVSSFVKPKCCFSIYLRCKYWKRAYKHKDPVCVWLYRVLDHPICLHLILPKTASALGLHGNRNPPCLISEKWKITVLQPGPVLPQHQAPAVGWCQSGPCWKDGENFRRDGSFCFLSSCFEILFSQNSENKITIVSALWTFKVCLSSCSPDAFKTGVRLIT